MVKSKSGPRDITAPQQCETLDELILVLTNMRDAIPYHRVIDTPLRISFTSLCDPDVLEVVYDSELNRVRLS